MEMPGADFMGAALAAAVANGTIATAYVDDAVVRTLTPMFQVRPPHCVNENTIMIEEQKFIVTLTTQNSASSV